MKFISKLMLDKVERLKIVFVTDIHMNRSAVEKLAEWTNGYYNTQPKFDYCFIGGDSANCDHDKNNHDEEEEWKNTLDLHKKIKDIFNCKLFFVPGNHDCKHFFSPNCKVEGFYNMHVKRIELTQGLELIGFGGSTPGYLDGKQYWSGYPYKSNKQLQAQWQNSEAANQKSKGNNQVIMLTHIGPQDSETSIDRSSYPQKTILAGGEFFNNLLQRKDIVCWLHGHTHEGSNSAKINGLQIMNPGALKYDRFMHLQLVKEDSKWKICKKNFELLS